MTKTLFILFKNEINYLLLIRLLSDHPSLKKGFTLKHLLKLPSLSWDDKKGLKEMFGGEYSKILTPEYDFKYQDGQWQVEQIDVQRGFHQFATRVLNHAAKGGEYPLESPVSTKDINFLKFLMAKYNEVYEKETKVFDVEGTPIDQGLLDFMSNGLNTRFGDTAYFNYGLVVAFLEFIHSYEEILIRREFGGGEGTAE